MKIKKDEIYFAKLKDKAIVPSKKDEDAGYDLYACFDEDYMLISPGGVTLVPTGIAWAISSDFYMQIEERSSTGSKGIKKNAGVIDSGYRGEILISILNARKENLIISNLTEENLKKKYPKLFKEPCFVYNTGKAIAEGVIHRVEKFKVKELSYSDLCSFASERGEKGWGSSNKVK